MVSLDLNRSVTPTPTTSWQKYVLTFTITGTISKFYIMLFFKNCLASTQDSDIQYWIDISSFKLEEGNIATDWTPSAEDVDQSVKAQISMCVQKDENNNLVSEINIASNKLTINTDNFTLAKDGTMSCTGATIKGGTLTCGIEGSNMTIANARLIHVYMDEEVGKIGIALDRFNNQSELIQGTHSVSISAGEQGFFEFDSNGSVNNGKGNGVMSEGTDIFCGYRHFRKFGDFTEPNYKVFQCGTGIYSDKTLGVEMYDCMLNQINCALKIERENYDKSTVNIYGFKGNGSDYIKSPALSLRTDGLYYNDKKLAFA